MAGMNEPHPFAACGEKRLRRKSTPIENFFSYPRAVVSEFTGFGEL
jgi:hypothetical protein